MADRHRYQQTQYFVISDDEVEGFWKDWDAALGQVMRAHGVTSDGGEINGPCGPPLTVLGTGGIGANDE
jgi:hypothetical protein